MENKLFRRQVNLGTNFPPYLKASMSYTNFFLHESKKNVGLGIFSICFGPFEKNV